MSTFALRLAVLTALLAPVPCLAVGIPVPGVGAPEPTRVDYLPDDSVYVNGRQVRPYRSELAPAAPTVGGGYVRGYNDGYSNGYSSGSYSSSDAYSSPQYAPSFNEKYGFTSTPR